MPTDRNHKSSIPGRAPAADENGTAPTTDFAVPIRSGRDIVDWGVAHRALPGQHESGDRHLVKVCANQVLVAVVDGLGHGEGAAAAARLAIATLEKGDSESPIALLNRCHAELLPTRGAVISLALFPPRDNTMAWVGVGNVEGLVLHQNVPAALRQEALLNRPGVVGDRLPPLSPSIVKVSPGDLLIFATDGIRSGFADHLNLQDPPQQIANQILHRHALETDDALVLVARFLPAQRTTATP